MEKTATLKWKDTVFDIIYTQVKSVIKLEEKYIIYIDEEGINFDYITSETERGIIVDMDHPSFHSMFILFENLNSNLIDLNDERVQNFLKYVIKFR